MTESELLQRIDKHLERADKHMERGNQIMAESNEIHRESRERRVEDREFIREMTVRQQRWTEQLVRKIDASTARVEAGTVELKDLNLATRQHTQALGRILDRLG